MIDITLGMNRTLTIAAGTVTNVTLPFLVRLVEIEKEDQPAFYLKVNSEVEIGLLNEAKYISKNILSFNIYNEPTISSGVPGIEYPFNFISFYSTSEVTIHFLNLTANAGS